MKAFFRTLFITLLLVLTAVQFNCTASAAVPDDTGYILRLAPDSDLSGLNFTPTPLGMDMYAVEKTEQVRQMISLGIVENIDRDDTLTVQDGYSAGTWYHKAVAAEAAWNHTDKAGRFDCRGDGVIIAVIDSGTYPHSDLNLNNFIDVDSGYTGYTQWHGTFVAGVIAAQLNGAHADGIVPNVKIMSLCITDGSGNTTVAKAVAAINYAVDNGAAVINLSISGTTANSSLELACQNAVNNGVIVVSCAGNFTSASGAASPRYPASFDCVISVSACRADSQGVTFADDFSCHNDSVDVCAPGDSILSLYVDGSVAMKKGTSFSSPIVAAMAAMAKQTDPDMTSGDFLKLLAATSVDMGAPGKDEYYGVGVVDIEAFTRALHPADTPSSGAFEDVADTDYFFDAVQWAVENNVASGVKETRFAPYSVCTRAQTVTFLYRAAGCPKPRMRECPFTDVKKGSYYYDAVIWACENGITLGVNDRKFDPARPVTREQAVTFLWRFARSLGMETDGTEDITGYTDYEKTSTFARDAFSWATGADLVIGTGEDTLGPRDDCQRCQITELLFRLDALSS